MVANADVAEVLSSQRGAAPACVLAWDRWKVVELALTLEKTKWLWDEMSRYRTLFSDFTRGDAGNFYDVVNTPGSLWLEILDAGKTVGIIYWTGLLNVVDADIHLIFFDRKPAEKVELCKQIGRWFFKEFPGCVRVTATLPIIYHATIRLAERIGFKWEGCKRRSQLMGGKYVDEVILGLLYEELT